MHSNDSIKVMMKGECYRFLAACFYLPQKEILTDEHFLKNFELNLRNVFPAAAPFAHVMKESLALYFEEDLAVEYAQLFVGPFGLKAPPYGSVYLDGERTVMGPSTIETIRCYEDEGLVRDAEFTELPDHIAVELEFMYFLCFREVEALRNGDTERAAAYQRKQEDFLLHFPGRWAPLFCRNIKEGTDNRFYTALADCLAAVISQQSAQYENRVQS